MTGQKKKAKKKPGTRKRRAKVSKTRIQKPLFEDDTPIVVAEISLISAGVAGGPDEVREPKKEKAAKAAKKKKTAKTGKKRKITTPGKRTTKSSPNVAATTDMPDVPTPSSEAAPVDMPVRPRGATSLMPTSDDARAVLDERAAALAKVKVEEQDERHHADYIYFRLGMSARYGVPYSNLDEVMYAIKITPVPCTPAFIAGVINRKGHLLTVVDLQTFFGVKKEADSNEARIIVVHHADMQVGLLVSAVEDSGRYFPDRLAPPLPSANEVDADYVTGIWDGTIAMLDIDALLSDAALTIDETVL